MTLFPPDEHATEKCPTCKGRGWLHVEQDHFDRFWTMYPRRVGKVAARKAYDRAASCVAHAVIYDAVSAYAAATATWTADERTYIPHPTTWLNQGRYADDRDTWRRKPTPTDAKRAAELRERKRVEAEVERTRRLYTGGAGTPPVGGAGALQERIA